MGFATAASAVAVASDKSAPITVRNVDGSSIQISPSASGCIPVIGDLRRCSMPAADSALSGTIADR